MSLDLYVWPAYRLHTLDRAVLRFPGDPQTWIARATFQLRELDRPRAALSSLEGALYLDPKSKNGRSLFLEARAERRRLRAERERRARARRADRARARLERPGVAAP